MIWRALIAAMLAPAMAAAVVVAEYRMDGNRDDAGGSVCALLQTGTVPFVASPTSPQGGQAAGVFSDANFLSGDACLRTAMQGLSEWAVTGYVYINAFDTLDPAMIEFYNGPAEVFWMQVLNDGSLRIGRDGGTFATSAAGIVSTGAWYHFNFQSSPTALLGSVSPAGAIDLSPDVSLAGSVTLPASMAAINLGRLDLAPGRWINGYLDQVIFWAGDPSTPTVTVTPSFSASPTPSGTATATPSATAGPSATASATLTASPSVSPSTTASATITASLSVSPSTTPTPTRTASGTPPPTATFSPTPSVTRTLSPAPTPRPTPRPLTLRAHHPNPNPAKDEVWLPYHLGCDADLALNIYTVSGERVRGFPPSWRNEGYNEERWDLRNEAGQRVGSGVFICRFQARSPAGESRTAFVKCAVVH